MVALDDGDRAAGLDQAEQDRQRAPGSRQVLEYEADERVVKAAGLERRSEDVGALELDVVQARGRDRSRACASDCSEMSIEVILACGERAASVTVWAPTPQPASSTRAPGG